MSNDDTGNVGASLTGTGWLIGGLNQAGDISALTTNGSLEATLQGDGWLVAGLPNTDLTNLLYGAEPVTYGAAPATYGSL